MLTIWFIGMYVIFILQQITIIYLCNKLSKLPPPKVIYGKKMKKEWFNEIGDRL